MPPGEDKLAEVFVFGEQNSVQFQGEINDRGIIGARRLLAHVDDIVARVSQTFDDPGVAAFIREKPHKLGRSCRHVAD